MTRPMRSGPRQNERGIAMILAIITMLLILTVAGAILTLAYNQRRLGAGVGEAKLRAYYRAKAGLVDAQWRIRTDPGGLFAAGGTLYDPMPYTLDTDGDGTDDVMADLGPIADATTAARRIDVRGLA